MIMFSVLTVSCFDKSKPNYQFFPNMYESVGYSTYEESDAFANGIEAQIPVEGTIPRGWVPYEYSDTNEGYELAKNNLLSPIEMNDENKLSWAKNPQFLMEIKGKKKKTKLII